MSQSYPDLPNTSFPELEDSWENMQDISASDIPLINQYKQYVTSGDIISAQNLLNNNPGLKNKIFSASAVNKIYDGLKGVQRFYLNNVNGFVETKQTEITTFINQKQTEFNVKIEQFTDKGDFNPSTQYYTQNFVRYNGELYIALKNNLNITPSNDGINWRLFSVKGDQGIPGLNLVYKYTYNISTSYSVGDAVNFNGTIYYCIQATIGGIDPTNNGYWQVFLSSASIPVSNTPPLNPPLNQLWIDTSI